MLLLAVVGSCLLVLSLVFADTPMPACADPDASNPKFCHTPTKCKFKDVIKTAQIGLDSQAEWTIAPECYELNLLGACLCRDLLSFFLRAHPLLTPPLPHHPPTLCPLPTSPHLL